MKNSSSCSWCLGVLVCIAGVGVPACSSSSPGDGPFGADSGTPSPDGGACASGPNTCSGNVLETCDAQGNPTSVDCGSKVCDPLLGCVACHPGSGTCKGSTSHVCRSDGSGYDDVSCDADLGLSCDPGSGACKGDCAPGSLGTSYIGCEYYPTVLANLVSENFDFAVAVSNTTSKTATVKITGGKLTAPATLTVPPSSVVTHILPWVPTLKVNNCIGELGCGGTPSEATAPAALVKNGAYHLKSTEPVTVYQFNALENEIQVDGKGWYSYSNEASLLFPVNAMTPNYRVAAWQTWTAGNASAPGLLAVTATEDGTVVTVATKASTAAGNGAPAFPLGTPTTVTMQAGDVLQLLNYSGDLTGSSVTASHPVSVFGGHWCTSIGQSACDHLEESMFPLETLGTSYLVTAPSVPSVTPIQPNPEVIRVVATQPNTTLTYEPAQPGAPVTLAAAGDFVEIPATTHDFRIASDKPVLVAQYFVGCGADLNQAECPSGSFGDPAMTQAVPTAQFRSNYVFHAPPTYDFNYVNVVAPQGSSITLDGQAVSGFAPIGTTGFGVRRVQLAPGGNGTHTAQGSAPFGLSVYGYSFANAYWYPGGLDLTKLAVH